MAWTLTRPRAATIEPGAVSCPGHQLPDAVAGGPQRLVALMEVGRAQETIDAGIERPVPHFGRSHAQVHRIVGSGAQPITQPNQTRHSPSASQPAQAIAMIRPGLGPSAGEAADDGDESGKHGLHSRIHPEHTTDCGRSLIALKRSDSMAVSVVTEPMGYADSASGP